MSSTRHQFSYRTGWDLRPSDLSLAIAEARRERTDLVDLSLSNPTQCGFQYDPSIMFGPLSQADSLIYDPDSRGARPAREAVARYYEDHAATANAAIDEAAVVDPAAIVLTTSTSEAYSFLFRLLCDAGDEVLVPKPSYPLFDFLADLDDVTLHSYPLFYDFGWWIDFAELERRIGPRTKAILLVHPNNPTGHWTNRAERQRLEELCVMHHLALIVDEVFLDYPLKHSSDSAGRGRTFAHGPHPALTFVLSGLSKVAALPQMKAAWLVCLGPPGLKNEALARLEMIADTFLSISGPAQSALPAWLASRQHLQKQIVERIRRNLNLLKESELDVLKVEAGWTALVRLRIRTDAARLLLEEARVIVQPGFFYGLSDPRLIILSLLGDSEMFAKGIRGIREADERWHERP